MTVRYLSAFFEATGSVLGFTESDPLLFHLFVGVIGAPTNSSMDALHARMRFAAFADQELSRGPLRRADVVRVLRMVRTQQTGGTRLVEYDAETGTTWEWNGNPVVLVIVCELACEAALRLEDQELFELGSSLAWVSLKAFSAAATGPAAEALFPPLAARMQAIERRTDVSSKLADFDEASA